jgi:hypothetical protein
LTINIKNQSSINEWLYAKPQHGVLCKSLNHDFIEDVDQTDSSIFHVSQSSNLNRFKHHGLKDLKNAELMNRVDTKYLIPIDLLEPLLVTLVPYYTALEIKGKRIFTYHNTYFDTDEYDFYHAHHQGKLNRYKVRHRNYVDSEKGFLEVKFKNNKGRTIKTRIESNEACVRGDSEKTFLNAISNKFDCLKAAQWGAYERIALANEACGERLTLDLKLRFSTIDGSRKASLPRFFIAELKQGKHNLTSPFAKEMSRLGIRAKKFSKYCIGCSLLIPELKANCFKPVISYFNKFH